MDDLTKLERLLRERLAVAETRRRDNQTAVRQEMVEHEQRTTQFEATATHLMNDIIHPRMLRLASLFPNAHVLQNESHPAYHSTCDFDRTPEHPASTKLDFGVSPDGAIGSAILTYSLEILPIFFKFDGRDQVVIPLDGVDDSAAASWVDAKLLAFTDTYLQIDSIAQYQQENSTIDPVCGMRVNRADAAGSVEYDGRTYYFCVDGCRQKFLQEPARYLSHH